MSCPIFAGTVGAKFSKVPTIRQDTCEVGSFFFFFLLRDFLGLVKCVLFYYIYIIYVQHQTYCNESQPLVWLIMYWITKKVT